MAGLQPYRLEPNRVPNPEDGESKKARFGVLVSDPKSCQRKECLLPRTARGRKRNRR